MLHLYNTLTKQIEPLAPTHEQPLTMYSCGPTVYDSVHIGNLRSYIMGDLIYRTIKATGQEVTWAMNITDIDDKTIAGTIREFGSNATVNDLKTYTQKFTNKFYEDLKAVNVLLEEIQFINVTDVIPQIQDFILKLLEKGYAYTAEDGSTYFSIEKYQADFGDYGELVGNKFLEGKRIGARVKVDEYDKDNLSDFALWKAWDQNDAQIFWDHPSLGKGRPGWHIECSVVNTVAFGENTTTLHTGGVDLIFPHHTNEIAQSQPIYKPFVSKWVHNEHILVDNKKMAKSAKNFYTLQDLAQKGYSGLDLRYLFLQSSYSTQSNFTWDSLEAARTARVKLSNATTNEQATTHPKDVAFAKAINTNLNTAGALAVAWDNKENLAGYDQILGLNLWDNHIVLTPENVNVLLVERQQARESKDFAKSDELRQQIEDLGYEVKDTPEGQIVTLK